MTADYTPTMEEVSIGYTLGRMGMVLTESAMEEFDRALAVHDAEVESRGADRERAAVVAMLTAKADCQRRILRECGDHCRTAITAGDAYTTGMIDAYRYAATAIEAGEHLGGTDD